MILYYLGMPRISVVSDHPFETTVSGLSPKRIGFKVFT